MRLRLGDSIEYAEGNAVEESRYTRDERSTRGEKPLRAISRVRSEWRTEWRQIISARPINYPARFLVSLVCYYTVSTVQLMNMPPAYAAGELQPSSLDCLRIGAGEAASQQ